MNHFFNGSLIFRKRYLIYTILLLITLAASGIYWKDNKRNKRLLTEPYQIDTLASGLIVPWEIVFLPDRTMLFTERSGQVRILRNDSLLTRPALLITATAASKKMGLLGICLHPRFRQNKYVYLSHNYKSESGYLLKVLRYEFKDDSLINPVIVMDSILASPNHTGCRLKFGPDGKLYISTGDADRPALSQNLSSLNGKILRVNEDGSIPRDNPFIKNDTARKEIWSYGHRNTQGMDFEPGSGQLYNSEHGPTGGDEINIVLKGENYGWPIIHHNDRADGMRSPIVEYSPSIGPSQILFYQGNAFPSLKGKLLVACLRGEKIMQFEVKGKELIQEDHLLEHQYGRLRALTTGPDGYLYFSTSQNDPPEGKPREGHDMILRLRPGGNIKSLPTGGLERDNTVTAGRPTSTAKLYNGLCAGCHGTRLEGSERAQALLHQPWRYGSSKKEIIANIKNGIIDKGMPAWEGSMTAKEIENLATYMIRNKK